MWADDPASRALGMELRDLGPGRAVVAMTVRADMVNGHAVGARRPGRRPRGQRLRAGLQLPRRAARSPPASTSPSSSRPTTATCWSPPPRSAPCAAAPASTTSRSAATTPSSRSSGAAAARCGPDVRPDTWQRSRAMASGIRRGVAVEFTGLTKRFGSLTAVDDLTFTVAPGPDHRLPRARTAPARPRRCGCCSAWSGRRPAPRPSTVGVRRPRPTRSRSVGAALEATDVHPGRSGRDHLRAHRRGRRHPGQPGRRAARDDRHPGVRAASGPAATRLGMRQRLGAGRSRCSATRGC